LDLTTKYRDLTQEIVHHFRWAIVRKDDEETPMNDSEKQEKEKYFNDIVLARYQICSSYIRPVFQRYAFDE
jgi:hypothetical protein